MSTLAKGPGKEGAHLSEKSGWKTGQLWTLHQEVHILCNRDISYLGPQIYWVISPNSIEKWQPACNPAAGHPVVKSCEFSQLPLIAL